MQYLKSVCISAVVRKPFPWRSRQRNKYVSPSGVSLFSSARTKSRKLSKSISRELPPPSFPRRTCSSKTNQNKKQIKIKTHLNVTITIYHKKIFKCIVCIKCIAPVWFVRCIIIMQLSWLEVERLKAQEKIKHYVYGQPIVCCTSNRIQPNMVDSLHSP